MNAVREFMNEHHLSPGLIDRAQLYFGLLWRQNRYWVIGGHIRLLYVPYIDRVVLVAEGWRYLDVRG